MAKVLRWYWCVKVDKSLSKDGEIYLYSDSVEMENGNLVFKREDGLILFSVASGMWNLFYAASCIDGAPVCVEHWAGIIADKSEVRL